MALRAAFHSGERKNANNRKAWFMLGRSRRGQGGSCCHSPLQKWAPFILQEEAWDDFLRGRRIAQLKSVPEKTAGGVGAGSGKKDLERTN